MYAKNVDELGRTSAHAVAHIARQAMNDDCEAWSKRVLNRVRGQSRMAAEQVCPGQAVTQRAPRLLLRFVGLTPQHEADLASVLHNAFSNRAGVQQLRVYRKPTDTGRRFLSLIEAHAARAAPCRACTLSVETRGGQPPRGPALAGRAAPTQMDCCCVRAASAAALSLRSL